MQEPLVFLPGLMCDARVFAPQVMAFWSERAVMTAPAYDGETVEDIASHLLDHLPGSFALAGHGLGGNVAMEILRRAPFRVTRVALLSATSLAETPQSATEFEPAIIKLRSGQREDAVNALAPPECFAPETDREGMVRLLCEMAGDIGAQAVINQVRALQRRRDYQSVLRRCKLPALVLCGAHDGPMVAKRHNLMAELMPFAELSVIEGAGQLPMLEQPVAVIDALRAWLYRPMVLQTCVEARAAQRACRFRSSRRALAGE